MATISFIIPTIGRPSLQRTLSSITKLPGDEFVVVEDIPPTGMWGNPQRNQGIKQAVGDYLSFIDDDDWYVPHARQIMADAIQEAPDRPILFRMQYPNGNILWKEKRVIPGNVSTQMILVPNKKHMLSSFKDGRNMGDFFFIDCWKWAKEEIVWREQIIAMLGHNDGKKPYYGN